MECLSYDRTLPKARGRLEGNGHSVMTSRVSGVRPEWMYEAACAAQRLAGSIWMDAEQAIDVRRTLVARTPPPVSAIEKQVLEGLIARAEIERRKHIVVERSPSMSIAQRASAVLGERFTEHWTIPRLARALGTNRFALTTGF